MVKLYLAIIALIAGSTAYFGNNYLVTHDEQAGRVLAAFIQISPSITPKSTPLPPTITLTPTQTPLPTEEPTPTLLPSPTIASTPLPTTSSKLKPATTPTSKPKITSTPTPSLKPSSTPSPTSKPTPTPTASPTTKLLSTPTSSPKPSATISSTPTPTSLPKPTAATSEQINSYINSYAGQYAVDPNVIRHIALCESGFNSNATNLSYAGLFQFSPSTWASYRNKMNEDPNADLRFNAQEAVQTAAYVLSLGRGSIWPNCNP